MDAAPSKSTIGGGWHGRQAGATCAARRQSFPAFVPLLPDNSAPALAGGAAEREEASIAVEIGDATVRVRGRPGAEVLLDVFSALRREPPDADTTAKGPAARSTSDLISEGCRRISRAGSGGAQTEPAFRYRPCLPGEARGPGKNPGSGKWQRPGALLEAGSKRSFRTMAAGCCTVSTHGTSSPPELRRACPGWMDAHARAAHTPAESGGRRSPACGSEHCGA